MNIQNNSAVSFHYKLTDDDGISIDSSEGKEPLGYLHGAGNIIPGLEKALEGKTIGDSLTVAVTAAEGYGEVQKELIQEVAKEAFQDVGVAKIINGQNIKTKYFITYSGVGFDSFMLKKIDKCVRV